MRVQFATTLVRFDHTSENLFAAVHLSPARTRFGFEQIEPCNKMFPCKGEEFNPNIHRAGDS